MKKDRGIETLRAFAILLVVAYHVFHDAAMEPARPFYDYLNNTLLNTRMPLFTVISGYLYGMRPVTAGNIRLFLRGKIRRILLPLVFVSSLEYIASSLLPGVTNPEPLADWWKVLIFPYEHFWFLQVIFVIFIIMATLERFDTIRGDGAALSLFLVSLLLYLVYPYLGLHLNFFSLSAVTYLFPFFIIGYFTSGRTELLLRWFRTPFLLPLLIVAVLLQQIDWFLDLPYSIGNRSLIGLVIGISSTALLVRHRVPLPGFARLGSYAYAIYLYQGFGTSVGRRIAVVLPDVSPHVYLCIVVATSAAFGVLTEVIVTRIPIARTFLLGKR